MSDTSISRNDLNTSVENLKSYSAASRNGEITVSEVVQMCGGSIEAYKNVKELIGDKAGEARVAVKNGQNSEGDYEKLARAMLLDLNLRQLKFDESGDLIREQEISPSENVTAPQTSGEQRLFATPSYGVMFNADVIRTLTGSRAEVNRDGIETSKLKIMAGDALINEFLSVKNLPSDTAVLDNLQVAQLGSFLNTKAQKTGQSIEVRNWEGVVEGGITWVKDGQNRQGGVFTTNGEHYVTGEGSPFSQLPPGWPNEIVPAAKPATRPESVLQTTPAPVSAPEATTVIAPEAAHGPAPVPVPAQVTPPAEQAPPPASPVPPQPPAGQEQTSLDPIAQPPSPSVEEDPPSTTEADTSQSPVPVSATASTPSPPPIPELSPSDELAAEVNKNKGYSWRKEDYYYFGATNNSDGPWYCEGFQISDNRYLIHEANRDGSDLYEIWSYGENGPVSQKVQPDVEYRASTVDELPQVKKFLEDNWAVYQADDGSYCYTSWYAPNSGRYYVNQDGTMIIEIPEHANGCPILHRWSEALKQYI